MNVDSKKGNNGTREQAAVGRQASETADKLEICEKQRVSRCTYICLPVSDTKRALQQTLNAMMKKMQNKRDAIVRNYL
jgi:hypothetical protein